MVGEAGSRAPRLLGRRSECEAIDRLLADVAGGASRVLVLRGDAGVGKSALLGYLSDHVAGWRVASAVGVESEMELAYSGLHQLCAPMLDHLERLPVPQRDALATVFGLSSGPAPDRFLVGLATLTLLADAAEQQPAGLHRRGRAVARQRFGADPRFRRPPLPRRADRARMRGTHGHRRRRPRWAAHAADPWTRRDRCTNAAARQRARTAGYGRQRPDHQRQPRQPARASRATANLDGRRSRRRIRAARQPTGGQQDRTELRSAAPRCSRPTPSCSSSPRPRNPSATPRCSTAPPRRSASTWLRPTPRWTSGCSSCAGGLSSPTHSSDLPPTAPPPPRTATGCIAPSRRPPTPRRTRIGALGTAPALRRARRGGGERTRALGRPGTVSRRARGRRRLSDPRDRTDARSGAAGPAGARCGLRKRARRRIRHRASPARHRAGWTGRRVATRADRPVCAPSWRSRPAAATRRHRCCWRRPDASNH